MNKNDLSYRDAMLELQSITKEIESDSIDLDELTAKVERASTLLLFCQEKLKNTDAQVKKILEKLDTKTES